MLSLADAIMQENLEQVRAALYYFGNLNHLDEYGFTPLIEAAIADNVAIARLLIENGADVNMQDNTGGTALHWSAENNNLNLSRLLLQHGANPNAYSLGGQPVLTMPILRQQQMLKKLLMQRQQQMLKKLLMQAGASLTFAQDFINAKLLGHLFELVGTADIIDPDNQYVEVDFEGFFLEVTLGLIADSLEQYKNHFAARQIRRYDHLTQTVVSILDRATQLIKFQQYRIDLQAHEEKINALLSVEPIVIPIGYEGHAITFVKLGQILVKCDRREESRLYDNVVFYKIKRLDILTIENIKNLIFEKQTSEFINNELPTILGLEPITEIKVPAQISGNCSWANVEACVPVLFFLLFSSAKDFQKNISQYKNLSLNFFNQWREWNKDRALQFCMQSFHHSDSIRKACKAEILVAILFQSCSDESTANKARMESIVKILIDSPYSYVLQNYVKSYCYEDQSEEGKYFLRFLKSHGYLEPR